MKTITEHITDISAFEDLAYEIKTGVLFDIETTGFKAEYNPIYMIGCAHIEDGIGVLTQFFAEDRTEERALVDAFVDYIEERNMKVGGRVPLITFNGNQFDIPYVNRRILKFGGSYSLLEHPKYDIYQFARRNKSLFGLISLKQKSLENFIGLHREDAYGGGELIDIYNEYADDRDAEKERLLLLHNNEDVKGMIALVPLFNLEMLREYGNIDIVTINMDKVSDVTYETDKICEAHDSYEIHDSHKYTINFDGKLKHHLPAVFTIHEEGIHLKIGPCTIKGILQPLCGNLRLYFDDPKSYVYLLKEQKIVPKVIATDVSKDLKRAPKKEECFVENKGIYLKLPRFSDSSYYDTHIYKKGLKEKDEYIKVDEKEGISTEWLSRYLSDILAEKICKQAI